MLALGHMAQMLALGHTTLMLALGLNFGAYIPSDENRQLYQYFTIKSKANQALKTTIG